MLHLYIIYTVVKAVVITKDNLLPYKRQFDEDKVAKFVTDPGSESTTSST